MSRFFRISREFLISGAATFCIAGCASHAPSLKMLDVRAGYDSGIEEEEVGLYQRGRFAPDSVARRSAPRVAKVHIYGHELPTKDYFLRGDVLLRVSDDEWVFQDPTESPAETPLRVGIREIRKRKKLARTGNPHKMGERHILSAKSSEAVSGAENIVSPIPETKILQNGKE